MLLFYLLLNLLVTLASAIPSHQLHHRADRRHQPAYGHHGQPAKYDQAVDEPLLRLRLTPPSYLLGKILNELIDRDDDDAREEIRLVKRSDEKPLGIPRTKPIHHPSSGAKPKPRHSKKHHKRSAILDDAPFNPLSYRFGKHQMESMKGCALCNAAGHSRNHHLHAKEFETLPNGLPDTTENVDPAILERLLHTIIEKRRSELNLPMMDEAELLLGGGFWEWPDWWPSWGRGDEEKEPPTCPIREEDGKNIVNGKRRLDDEKNIVKSYASGKQRLEEALRQQQAKLRGMPAFRVQDGIVHTWKGKPIIEIMSFVPGLGQSGKRIPEDAESIIKPLAAKKPMPQPRDEIDDEEPIDEEEPPASNLPGWLQSICDYFDWDCSNINWPFSSTNSNFDKRRLLTRAACALSLGALLTMVAISLWTVLGIFFPNPYNRVPKEDGDYFDDDEDYDDEGDEEEFSRAEKGFSRSGIMPSAHDGCIKCGKH